MDKHLDAMSRDGSWTYSFCDSCIKNAHEKVKMIREKVSEEEMWVCPICGSAKRL